MKTKYFTVYSLKVAAELCNKGFKVAEVKPNRAKPWLNVFYFENSDEFQDALNEITQ